MFEYASSYRLPRELEQGMLDGFNWHFDAYFESGERISSSELMNDIETAKGEIVMYQPDETIRLEVRAEDDTVYLFGASLKDAGKKLFAFIEMQETKPSEILSIIS